MKYADKIIKNAPDFRGIFNYRIYNVLFIKANFAVKENIYGKNY